MGNGAARSDVLRALKVHNVLAVPVPGKPNLYCIERGDFLETQVLDDTVPMWILNRFKRLLNIPIHHFWHPEVAEQEAQEKMQQEAEAKMQQVPVRRIKST